MERGVLFAVLSVVTAFVFAASVFWVAGEVLHRRKAVLAAQGEKLSVSSLVLWRLRNGYAFLVPPAQVILKWAKAADVVDEAVYLLDCRGVTSTSESLMTVVIALVAVLGCFVGLVTASPIAAVAVPACVCALMVLAVGNARDKRMEAARDSVPAALESMAACFGSGFTLQQTFQQVAQDVDGPLSETFSRASHVLEMGGGADRALRELRRGTCATELAFVAVALDVQHQSGGAMRQVLQAATETVKGELALRRSLRVQTAQAKLSARVVAVMPFILVSAFSLASPDFLMPFFQSVQGYALLALAILMQVAGIVLVRRALSVEGVS